MVIEVREVVVVAVVVVLESQCSQNNEFTFDNQGFTLHCSELSAAVHCDLRN